MSDPSRLREELIEDLQAIKRDYGHRSLYDTPFPEVGDVIDRVLEVLRAADAASPGEGWQPIETAPENEVVWTKIHDEHGSRNEQLMKRQGRLWWYEDGSMYVYYTPTHWRADADPAGRRSRSGRE